MLFIAAKFPSLIGAGAFVYLAGLGESTPYAIWHEGHCDMLIDPPTFNIVATEELQEVTEASVI